MNAYFVDAGWVTDDCGCGFTGCMDGSGFLVDIVFAETLGKAKYALWAAHRYELDALTEVPWSVYRLAHGVRHGAGILGSDEGALYDVLWQLVGRVRPPRALVEREERRRAS